MSRYRKLRRLAEAEVEQTSNPAGEAIERLLLQYKELFDHPDDYPYKPLTEQECVELQRLIDSYPKKRGERHE